MFILSEEKRFLGDHGGTAVESGPEKMGSGLR